MTKSIPRLLWLFLFVPRLHLPLAEAQTLQLVTVDTGGSPADGQHSSISADGRFGAFASSDSDLVQGDTNSHSDIFVWDRQTRLIKRISLGPNGAQANEDCFDPVISADGKFVAFESRASNLVGASVPSFSLQIYSCNLTTGVVSLVSVSSSGVVADDICLAPSISADGRFVAFQSRSTKLVTNYDYNSKHDVFVRDQVSGKTTLVSLRSDGTAPKDGAEAPSISADGRFVAFHSKSSDLVAGDTNGESDVFVYDRLAAKTFRVSVTSSAGEANGASTDACISGNGRFIGFISFASNLVSGDTNSRSDIFVHDFQTKATTLISRSSSGEIGNDTSGTSSLSSSDPRPPSLSDDGRFVAFVSKAKNLVPGVADYEDHVFAHDRTTGETVDLSGVVATLGISTGYHVSMAGNGQAVACDLGSEIFLADLRSGGPVFPQYANGETAGMLNRSRIIIRNGSSQPDAGQIRFRDAGGNPAQVPIAGQLLDSVDYSLPAWGTFELSTDGTGALQSGTVEVTTNRGVFSGIRATEAFQLLGHDVSLDSSPVRPGHSVYVSVNAKENTGLAIFNPDAQQVTVKAQLADKDGHDINQPPVQLQLAGHSQVSLFVDAPDLFASYLSTKSEFTGTLSLSALDRKMIAAVGLIQKRETGALIAVETSPYFKNYSRYTLPAQANPSLLFPQFANGEIGGVRNSTRVILKNIRTSPAGEVRFQDPLGNPLGVPINGQIRSTVPYSLWNSFCVKDFETDGTGNLVSGSIEVVPGSSALEGTEVFEIMGHFVSVPSCPARSVHQVYASMTSAENTGIAVYNPETTAVTLDLWLLNEAGQQVAARQLSLAGRERVAVFLDEEQLFKDFFAGQPADFHGTVNIRAAGGKLVAVLGLIQRRASGALMSVGAGAAAYAP